ncbi:aldo/keto reductase [Amycolatopsis carbonis]|uniref:Aldo/keto reductase n=1 Tax=Amycolatopsis carbonis TaxID=715471 RepID=A0A9Y2MYX9_9PSEU|nr:aldo/keto reductase [Amycolatopsis sp. 2-15]WIX83996.1 aldo/keto reductase [Amycolatopsis sp. 2-15]
MDRVRSLAEEKGVAPGQVGLAWVMSHDVVPIPRTKRRKYLNENAAAADVSLSEADLARLEAAVPHAGRRRGSRHARRAGQDERLRKARCRRKTRGHRADVVAKFSDAVLVNDAAARDRPRGRPHVGAPREPRDSTAR